MIDEILLFLAKKVGHAGGGEHIYIYIYLYGGLSNITILGNPLKSLALRVPIATGPANVSEL